MTNGDRIILGIDPGTNIMGYGVVCVRGKEFVSADMGIVKMNKIKDVYLKLKEIHIQTMALIKKYTPDELAIEAPFYGKNVQSMLKLGRAQGVAISAALQHDIPIYEYAPRKIKLAITGTGTASKEQVADMLKSILKINIEAESNDATDGLAVALCHFYQRSTVTGKSYNGWKDFVSKNPEKKK